MKNSFLILILSAALTLFMVSCGGEKKEEPTKEEKTEETHTEDHSEAMNETSEEPTEKAGSDETSEEPTEEKEEVKKADNTKGPWTGRVVALSNALKSSLPDMTKAQINQMKDAGNSFVFVVDGKAYFVFNQDGTFASDRIAGYAAAKQVVIKGKLKTVAGVNVIILDMIDAVA